MSYNLHVVQILSPHENNLCNLAFAETIFHIRSSCLCGRFGKWIHFLVIWLLFITQTPCF